MAERKVALVTGAGTGVGRAVTLALMREGYAVVLAGRRKELLDTVAKEGAQTPGEALTVAADVADPASIRALFAKAKDNYQRHQQSQHQQVQSARHHERCLLYTSPSPRD